jgi:hypothetical protein
LNLALSAGSSKQGKALRASVDWNCVTATHLIRAEQTHSANNPRLRGETWCE